MPLLSKVLLGLVLLLPGGFVAAPLLLWLRQRRRLWSLSRSSLMDSVSTRAASSLRRAGS